MKTLRKIMTLALTVAVVLSLGVLTAFAADEYTITITSNGTGAHTYTAYQVFSGDLATKDGKKVLSNIQWGAGVDGSALLDALQADETYGSTFDELTTAAQVAEKLAAYQSDSDAIKAISDIIADHVAAAATSGASPLKVSAPGYYFLQDTTATVAQGDTRSDYMLEVVADVSVTAKDSRVTVEKKTNDQDAATASVGDSVPFTITGTLPDNYADYTTFSYVFSDKMSQGLTYTAGTATITVDGTDITASFTETVGNADADGNVTITWTCTNLKEINAITADSQIVVTYSAVLNDNAVVGQTGNANEASITYSNDPNSSSTGTTVPDVNKVYTFNVQINKVDGSNQPLDGAGFTLYKKSGDTWTQVGSEQMVESKDGAYTTTFAKLAAGDYKLSETTTPAGYNTMDDKEFTIAAAMDTTTTTDLGTLTISGSGLTFSDLANMSGAATNIVNKSGSILPSTGGMGTTIFYGVGGLLVVGAVVFFVSKKRAGSQA